MKTIRTWVYALLEYDNQIVVIKKWRGPFTGLYDLPWGKIEHWEHHKDALLRELIEEIWVSKEDISIQKLLTVKEEFVEHTWEWQEKEEHIIAIVYKAIITSDTLDLSYMETWWDSEWIKLIDYNDEKSPKTPILKKVLTNN